MGKNSKNPRRFSTKKILLALTGIGFLLFISFFIVTGIIIGNSVREKCKYAQKKHKGDCVEALTTHLKDENNPFGERNSAIWALGQLGNSRALPALEIYYTGEIPNREPWNEVISQYELKKAIKLCKGSFNATHILWRRNLP